MAVTRKPLVTEAELMSATVTADGDLEFTRDSGAKINAGQVRVDVTPEVAAARDEAVAAADRAEAVGDTNDTIMAAVAADAGSAFAGQLNASIAEQVEAGGFARPPAYSITGVVDEYVWVGDSLSAQGGGTGVAPGNYLAAESGRTVNIDAVGGEKMAGIAARLNAAPLLMTPEGGEIPTSGDVKVTFTSPTGETVWPLLQPNGNPAIGQTWAGTLAGIHGVLSLVQPSGASTGHQADDYYLFTRTTLGSALAVVRPAPFLTDYGVAHAGKFHVLWGGRNDVSSSSVDADLVLATLDMIVRKILAEGGDFLILSVLNGAGEGTGTDAYERITSFNTRVQARYPERYADVRGGLISRGLDMAGITPTSQDSADIAADIVPDSLRTDSVHLEVAAREVVAKLTHEDLRYFGRTDAPAAEFADDFNRADSTDLGSGWETGHNYQIVSNQLTRVGTFTTPELLVPALDLGASDMEVSVDIITRGGSSSTGVIARYLDANNFLAVRINATGNALIYKVIGGTTGSLSGLDGAWSGDPARLTLRVIGDVIEVLRDGVKIIGVTAAVPELAAATRSAIRTASDTVPPVLDNFEARAL